MTTYQTIGIYNLEALEDICDQKDISLEFLMNFIFDQYIIYYNEALKTYQPNDIEPRFSDIQETKRASFKRFVGISSPRIGRAR